MVLARRCRSRKLLPRLRVTDGVNRSGRRPRRHTDGKCVPLCLGPYRALDESQLARYLSVEIVRWRRSRARPSPDLVTHNPYSTKSHQSYNSCSSPASTLFHATTTHSSPSVHSSGHCRCDCRYLHGATTIANSCTSPQRRSRPPLRRHHTRRQLNLAETSPD